MVCQSLNFLSQQTWRWLAWSEKEKLRGKQFVAFPGTSDINSYRKNKRFCSCDAKTQTTLKINIAGVHIISLICIDKVENQRSFPLIQGRDHNRYSGGLNSPTDWPDSNDLRLDRLTSSFAIFFSLQVLLKESQQMKSYLYDLIVINKKFCCAISWDNAFQQVTTVPKRTTHSVLHRELRYVSQICGHFVTLMCASVLFQDFKISNMKNKAHKINSFNCHMVASCGN